MSEHPPPKTGGDPDAAPFLLLAIDDLMASSRVEAVAGRLGFRTRYARTVDEFRAAVADGPALVLLGTQHTRLPWQTLLPELRGSPPVLAFGPHLDAETRHRVRRAGATRWVANSRLAADLPGLIQALARQP